MKPNTYYYNCSPEYIHSIDPDLHGEVESMIQLLPKREKQTEINADLFWMFTFNDWCYDTIPAGYSHECPETFDIRLSIHENELPRSRADGVSTANRKKGNAASCGEFTQID